MENKDIYWGNSECVGTWLHKFKIYMEREEGVAEICLRCKKRVFFPVRNGQIDNQNYLDYHKRELLFPAHPYFKHEYPNFKYGK